MQVGRSERSSSAAALPRPAQSISRVLVRPYLSDEILSYQQRAAYNNQDTTVLVAWLRIDRRNLVLDLLERQILTCSQLSLLFLPRSISSKRTCSFSTIGPVPCVGAASNVSMESSRW